MLWSRASGGEGWCANSTCRRVLVTHDDGSQTVEEIKNDLGITAEDKGAMKANLEAQGIDVANMSLTSNPHPMVGGNDVFDSRRLVVGSCM